MSEDQSRPAWPERNSRPAWPERSDWLERYHQINESFAEICVYRTGTQYGFFAEYVNLVLCLLYCLNNGIRLHVSSARANYAVDKGWADYFLPALIEDNSWYNRHLNTRPSHLSKTDLHLAEQIRRLKGIDYFTQDIWGRYHSVEFQNARFHVPELGLDGDLVQAASVVIEQLWRFQPAVDEDIRKAKERIALPADYVGIHIRRGDKLTEAEPVSTEDYFRKAEQATDLRTAFVASDDHKVVAEAREKFPNWRILSLSVKWARGHLQRQFDAQDKDKLYREIVRLLADIEVLSGAQTLLVTYTSNVGKFLGMRLGERGRSRIVSLDLPSALDFSSAPYMGRWQPGGQESDADR